MSNLFPILTGPSLVPEDRFFRKFYEGLTDQNNSIAIDLKDEGDHFLLEADLPGIAKDHIKISYQNNILTLQTEKSEERKEEDEDRHFVVRERCRSSSMRQMLIEGVKANEITAAMDNGVLKVRLPKIETQPMPEGREIPID